MLAVILVGIWLLARNWPFRYEKMKPLLEQTFGSHVTIAHFALTYFPNPGFVASGLTLQRNPASSKSPMGTVDRFEVQSHWLDVLTLHRRLQLVRMDHVHLVLPPPGSQEAHQQFPQGSTSDFAGPEIPIQTLDIRNSLLEIQRVNGSRYAFPIYALHLEHLHRGDPMTFAVDMENAIPSGHIRASGRFGPLNAKQVGATPVSGEFKFLNIQLHDVGHIRGNMSAFGRFEGRLDALAARATTNTPDFAVDSGRPTPVAGAVRCTVNGLNGDVEFQDLEARSGRTIVKAAGAVKGEHKTTDLDVRVEKGRAEDLLRPFLERPVPIEGPATLHLHAHITPEGEGKRFLQRLQVNGAFDVPAEMLTDAESEKKLSAFSWRSQDKDKPEPPGHTVLSSLSGPATISNGIVHSDHLEYKSDGIEALLHGTFNLNNSAVHLTGQFLMKGDISHTASGMKSILLKPLAPFFHHKHAGAIVSIAVTGKPGHYHVSQNITHNK